MLNESDPSVVHKCSTCSRRTLLRGIGIAVVGSVVTAACGSSGNIGGGPDASTPDGNGSGSCPTLDLCIDITKAPNTALETVNGAVAVQVPHDTIMVVRTSATAVAALSAICTHQGCQVQYTSNNHQLFCPCHGAAFSLTGQVLQGPTNTPLKTYTATLTGNIITIVNA
jgi:cytochrome b6-f complex iron-sulfur subunit